MYVSGSGATEGVRGGSFGGFFAVAALDGGLSAWLGISLVVLGVKVDFEGAVPAGRV